jgi:tRNA1Val (adenine37-N6)-methyltransferase
MKIGTDGVYLVRGPIKKNPFSILILERNWDNSLNVMQRNAEQIDALEIDQAAYEQAVDNFENSWIDRLFCFHAGLDEFVEDPEDEYDLIVSNPPFYSENYKTENEQRDLARFQEAMPLRI